MQLYHNNVNMMKTSSVLSSGNGNKKIKLVNATLHSIKVEPITGNMRMSWDNLAIILQNKPNTSQAKNFLKN